MTTQVKYPDGIKVRAGGREMIVPSLSFRATKTLLNDQMAILAEIKGPPKTPEHEAVLFAVILASLQRNYPEIDEKWLMDECGLVEIVNLAQAVLKATLGIATGDGPNAQTP